MAAAITAAVDSGALSSYSDKSGPPPTLPHGTEGEFVQYRTGLTILPPGYDAVVNAAKNATIVGLGWQYELVLSGTGGLTFWATGGSGSVVAGGGDNMVFIPPRDRRLADRDRQRQ